MDYPPVLGDENNGIFAKDQAAYQVLLEIRDKLDRSADIVIFQREGKVYAKSGRWNENLTKFKCTSSEN